MTTHSPDWKTLAADALLQDAEALLDELIDATAKTNGHLTLTEATPFARAFQLLLQRRDLLKRPYPPGFITRWRTCATPFVHTFAHAITHHANQTDPEPEATHHQGGQRP